jgi:hypothetical protein
MTLEHFFVHYSELKRGLHPSYTFIYIDLCILSSVVKKYLYPGLDLNLSLERHCIAVFRMLCHYMY